MPDHLPQHLPIGLVQYAMDPDPARNREHAAELATQAAGRGAAVVCLPELFCTPYFCQGHDQACFDLAEPVPGPSTEFFATLTRKLGIYLIVPLFERRAPGLYHNTAAVLGPDGELVTVYRKLHIPEDPGFHEKYYFTPGDTPVGVFPTPWGPVGVLICWDQWFPEAARLAALAGARVLFYPTAIGRLESETPDEAAPMREAWEVVQRGHAVANGLFVAAVNRAGFEPPRQGREGLHFWGSSFVSGPFGEVLERAGEEGDAVLVVDCDLAHQEQVRRTWPFLRDRRVDAYGPLLGRFGAGS